MQVRLQAMADEARELVRTGSYDEAIAICRHILKEHPKHVESYRVLAEACLEKGDYEEATNLFKRVLSAAPHNFIAYVGLGIVYDEDGLLDEAIWQFERAFELVPANSEVRQMLKRLYGQRDGVEPQRLKLNRAALGHLYAKGGLYTEAIAEFREVLAQSPERIDIQLAMAEAYWRANQRREAAEICQDILNKMPNCLKANLMLGEIWTDSGLEDEGETLLRRAKNMDPESLVAQELLGERSPLPPEEVLVEPLESVEAELAEMSTAEELVEPVFPALEEPSVEVSFAEFEEAAIAEGGDVAEETAVEVTEEVIGEIETVEEVAEETIAEAEELGAPFEEAVSEAAEIEIVPEGLALAELAGQVIEGEIDEVEEPKVAAMETSISALEVEDVEEALAPPTEGEIAPAHEIESMAPAAEPEAQVAEAQASEEDESPIIAALEEEFGALPELDLAADAEAERLSLEASMPDESASTEEILAWLERQRQATEEPAALAEPEGAEPAGEEEAPAEVRPLAELEEAIQEAATPDILPEMEVAEEAGPEGEEESPVIAALEAEFGSLPGLETEEASDEERLALESSMPPETASPEEIMAWLREQGTLAEMMPLPAMPEEGIPEAIADLVDEIEPVEEAEPPSEALPKEQAADEIVSLKEAQAAIPEMAIAGEAAQAKADEGEIEIESEAELEAAEMAMGHDDLMIDFLEPAVEQIEAAEVVLEEEGIVEAVEAQVADTDEALEAVAEAIEAKVAEVDEALEATPEAIEAESVEIEGALEEAAPEVLEVEAVEVEEAAPEAIEAKEALEEAVPEAVEAEIAEIEEALPEPEMAEAALMIADWLAAVEQNPDDPATRLALARAYVEEISWDEASEQYETLARSAPDVLDDVIADLEAITTEQPDLLALQQVLGDAYMEAGQLQDALDKYNWLLTRM